MKNPNENIWTFHHFFSEGENDNCILMTRKLKLCKHFTVLTLTITGYSQNKSQTRSFIYLSNLWGQENLPYQICFEDYLLNEINFSFGV